MTISINVPIAIILLFLPKLEKILIYISEYRDTITCILTLRMAFDKYKEFPGKALKFVADGYNSYKLAEQQFKLHNMDFDSYIFTSDHLTKHLLMSLY